MYTLHLSACILIHDTMQRKHVIKYAEKCKICYLVYNFVDEYVNKYHTQCVCLCLRVDDHTPKFAI